MTKVLSYTPRKIAVGEVTTAAGRRFFVVMAGCGPDGALVHALSRAGELKSRFGRSAYHAHAARLFATRR